VRAVVEIGTVSVRGLPPAYSAALANGLAGALEILLDDHRPAVAKSRDSIRACAPQDWSARRPDAFVRTIAELIARSIAP